MGCPVRAGRKLTESSAAFAGTGMFSIAQMVAKKSVRQMSWSEVVPGLMVFGHFTRKGTRWPPSQRSAFEPRRWALG